MRLFLSIISLLLVINVFSVDIKESSRMFYIESMKALGENNKEQALINYEKALYDDSNILSLDDKGLLNSLTLKYLKLQNENSKDLYLYKLGSLFRFSGNYDEAVNFYNKLIKDFPKSSYVDTAVVKVYEITILKEQLKSQSTKKETAEVKVVTDKKTEKNNAIEENKAEAEQKNRELAEKYSSDASNTEKEIAKLRNDYDLWFSLEYGEHKYKKESYYKPMVYYYEKKLKEAEKKLNDIKEKLDKLK